MTTPSADGDQPTYVDPVTGQQLYIDPVTGQLAYENPAPAAFPVYPGYAPGYAPVYPGYPGYPGAPDLSGYPIAPDLSGYPASPDLSGYPGAGTAPGLPPSSTLPAISGELLPRDAVPPPGAFVAYPTGGYTAPAFPGYGVAYPAVPRTNSLATASMVLSIVGGALAACYGVGVIPAIVGAILGHVARRQIRQRGEAGAGMALAGIIIGWIVTGLALVAIVLIVIFVVYIVNNPAYNSE